MRPARILLLLVALVAGGLAAFLATRGDRPAQVVAGTPQVIAEARAQVLVANAEIGMAQRLTAENLKWQDWPEGAVRPEFITIAAMPDAIETLTGAVARFELFPGEPVLERKLVKAEQGYLSAVLEKGKRGISIAVTADSASGGFIVPNDRVDVVMTRSAEIGEVSETILSNVKVLAINTRLGEKGTTGAPADPENPRAEVFSDRAIATLELDPAQGETVVNAASMGRLSLALRSMADFNEVENPGAPRSSSQAIRMIRGGKEQNVQAAPSTAPTVEPAAFTPVPTPIPAPMPLATPETQAPGATPVRQ